MRGRHREEAIAGAFEELPALLVILISISLYTVTLASATASWDNESDYSILMKDCMEFADMVKNSAALGASGDRVLDSSRLSNESASSFLEEFNSSQLGFKYRVSILELGCESPIMFGMNPEPVETATVHTCVGVESHQGRNAAKLTVTIWRCP